MAAYVCAATGPAGRRWDRRPHLAAARHRRRPAPRRPGHRDHRARHRPRAGDAGGPGGRLPARADPAGAAAASAGRRPAAHAGPAAGAMKAALEVIDRVRPDVVVGFGGYVSVPAYLAARKRKLPLVVHEGNALPGHRQQARRPVHHPRRHQLPRHRPAARALHRPADPPDDQHPRPGGAAGRGRASFGLDPDRPTLLVTGGSQGARRLNQSVAAAAPAFAAAGVQVLHIVGPQGEASPETDARRPAVRHGAVRQPDGPRVRRRRRRPLPRRQQHRHRGVGRRPARDLRAAADRQRRAGPQRPPGRRRGRRPAGRRRRPDPGVGERRPSPTCSPTPHRLATMSARGRRRDPARRRRQARRHDPRPPARRRRT